MTLSLKAKPMLSEAHRYWELLYVLVERNLKGRYRGSFLGVYWSLLNPLIMTGIYATIFGSAFATYYNNSTLDYVLAAFTGLSVINFYSASTSQALASVVSNGALLNKIKLPVSVFPVSMIAANGFQFAVGMFPLLLIVTLIRSHSVINAVMLTFPFISLSLICTGIGFFVSALYVFFRDLPYFYEIFTFVLWFTSPIFYPPDIVPKSVRPLLELNPLSPIIESIRHIALSNSLPSLSLMLRGLLSGVIVLAIGFAFFRWCKPRFMDLL